MKPVLIYKFKMLKHTVVCIAVLCLSILSFAIQAQEIKEHKVGLVLSGGGAKGFAHIGVLKVIDSLGIKIDCVAGTSMGAVIGSLYASGYSGIQLEAMFKQQDFETLINDKIPRSSKSFYEKYNAQTYAISLPFDRFKVSLPSGLSRGQNVYNLLYQLMLPVNHIRDFSQLPIPFFCVATDIETGQFLILDHGNLAEAVTASSALPSLFQPVKLNGQLLIDGGVTNNFPIEDLRTKGMDVIIGVDVQDGLKDRMDLKTAPDILLQINNFRTINAMKDKAPLTDVYIKPDIEDFSVISFSDGQHIIASGEKAAQSKLVELKSIKQQQSPKVFKPLPQLKDSITIKNLSFKGNDNYTRAFILGKLKIKGNEKISYQDFKDGIDNLIATNNFNTFRYELLKTDEADTYNLVGTISEVETTTFLKFGVHFDDLYKSAILANVTKKRLLFNNDLASLDLILGDNSRYNFNYFIDKGFYISIGVSSRFNQFNKNINPDLALDNSAALFNDLNRLDVKLQDFTNQIYFQTLFRKDFAFQVGVEYKYLKITSETILDENQRDNITFDNSNYLSLFGNLKFDSYDHPYYPKRGLYFNGTFNLFLNASGFNRVFEKFSIAKADLGFAQSIGKKFALKTETSGGFRIGDNSTRTLNFALGGYTNNFINNFYSFYGYDFIDVTANSFVKATFTLDYEVLKKNHILLAANFANIDDGLFETGQFFSSPNYSGYAVGCSLDSFVGPLEVKYTYSPETGSGYWFFNLGFWF